MTATHTRDAKNGRPAAKSGTSDALVPAGEPVREDTSHDGLMAALADVQRTASLQAKVSYMARTRYGIRVHDAQDIFHESVATYLSIHSRYPAGDNHFGILVGIFQRKALEHLGARSRTDRVAERLVTRLRAENPNVSRGEDPEGTVTDRVIREEDAHLIRSAIESLAPDAREMLLSLAEGRTTRLELIRDLGINRNTFDTRLRALRLRLRKSLETSGVI